MRSRTRESKCDAKRTRDLGYLSSFYQAACHLQEIHEKMDELKRAIDNNKKDMYKMKKEKSEAQNERK